MTDQQAVEIDSISDQPLGRTQQLLQVLAMLDLFQAEGARILHLHCADIAAMGNARARLQPHTEGWRRAADLIALYQSLYRHLHGDGVQMRHWLRRQHPKFAQTPHLMLIDEDRLPELLAYLRTTDDLYS